MNEFNNLEFNEASFMRVKNKYTGGVSIDFSSGQPLKDRMEDDKYSSLK